VSTAGANAVREQLPPPPELPGYRYLRPIEGGSGGYAHVYVYEQASPRREVAVKVLKARRVGGAEVREILDEANAMARLGNHPHIVTVLDARTAADGRPCIIMMYCSGPNLMQLVSRGALDVHRVVRLGIQIADVLHFAHRVNIIHRDIKPANILTDELGNPRLTDFGIAARVVPGEDTDDRQFGVSLPWCPPELLRGEAGSVASDIYSLGATLWHLLVGRSPVDVPGHNTRPEIEHRILHVPAPPTNRPDVPASLERLLARMLAKRPDERPSSAAHVKDELTRIEQQLGAPRTTTGSWYAPASVIPSPATSGTPSPAGLSADDGRTTVRDSRPRPSPSPVDVSASADGAGPTSVEMRAHEPTILRTTLRTDQPERPPSDGAEAPPETASRRGWAWAAALVVVLAAVGGLVALRPWAGSPPPPGDAGAEVEIPDPANELFAGPPGRPAVEAERIDEQTVRFTWTYSNLLESDTYAWRTDTGEEDTVDEPTLDLPVPAGVRVCVQVRVYREDGSYASATWSDYGCGGDE